MKKPRVFNGLMACSGKNIIKGGKQSDAKSKPLLSMNTAPAPNDIQRNAIELSDRCTRVLRLLLDARCPIDAPDKTFGVTPLDMAILLGDVESTVVLMAAGADARHLIKVTGDFPFSQQIMLKVI